MADLELLSIGLINDMYAESRNDDCKYAELAIDEGNSTDLNVSIDES